MKLLKLKFEKKDIFITLFAMWKNVKYQIYKIRSTFAIVSGKICMIFVLNHLKYSIFF